MVFSSRFLWINRLIVRRNLSNFSDTTLSAGRFRYVSNTQDTADQTFRKVNKNFRESGHLKKLKDRQYGYERPAKLKYKARDEAAYRKQYEALQMLIKEVTGSGS